MVTQWPCLMPPIIQQVALFFLCTNVGYSVVVGFVTRSDQSSLTNWWSIQIMWDLKKESSIWVTIPRLNYLLLNKCFLRAKHSLLAFPDTYVIFIISKHGTKDHKHGLTSEQREEFLLLLRDWAYAPPADPTSKSGYICMHAMTRL